MKRIRIRKLVNFLEKYIAPSSLPSVYTTRHPEATHSAPSVLYHFLHKVFDPIIQLVNRNDQTIHIDGCCSIFGPVFQAHNIVLPYLSPMKSLCQVGHAFRRDFEWCVGAFVVE